MAWHMRGRFLATGQGAVFWCAMAAVAGAQEWVPAQGGDIRGLLERRILRYADGSEQFFNYGGLTEYRIGWPNEGRWKVLQDQYCAQWPPVRDWQCYDVALSTDGGFVQFLDARGGVFVGQYLDN